MNKYIELPLGERIKKQTDRCRKCINNECLCIKCGYISTVYMVKCGVMFDKNRECAYLTETFCSGFIC